MQMHETEIAPHVRIWFFVLMYVPRSKSVYRYF